MLAAILTAARRRFDAPGADTVTHDDIATDIGIKADWIRNYFPSIADLQSVVAQIDPRPRTDEEFQRLVAAARTQAGVS
jgi:hypothetical protein